MKTVRCHSHRGPRAPIAEDVPLPAPGPGEVRIPVMPNGRPIAGASLLQHPPPFMPALLLARGGAIAGITGALVGEAVLEFNGSGGFAQEVTGPAALVTPMPSGTPFERGGSPLMTDDNYLNALVERSQRRAGETVLTPVAAGATGTAAIEIGRSLGPRIMAATSNAAKLAVYRDEAADELVNYPTEYQCRYRQTLCEGCGSDGVCGPVGEKFGDSAVRTWGRRAGMPVIGCTRGELPPIRHDAALLKRLIVSGFWDEFTKFEPTRPDHDARELEQMQGTGRIAPLISMRDSPEEAGSAVTALLVPRGIGEPLATQQTIGF